jgi:membrane protease YdiL (CAAX protease family)
MLLDIWAALRHLLIGLVVLAVVTAPWSVIAAVNLRLSPQVPWAIPIGLTYLGLVVAYLNGRGWPTATADIRRRHFRARLLSGAESLWSLLAGILAITCLWLLFAAFGNLGSKASPGREATLPAVVLFMFVIVSSVVTAVGEEGAFRGFMQAPLERRFGPRAAIVASTVAFVLIHATHGLPVLVRTAPFYVAAGIVYGVLAYLTQSILPALALHFLGDVVTFALRSSLIRLPGPHSGTATAWCIAGAVVVGGLSIVAFSRLADVSASTRISQMSKPNTTQ